MLKPKTREIIGKVSVNFMGQQNEYSSAYDENFYHDRPIKLTETASEVRIEYPVKEPYTSHFGQQKHRFVYQTATFPKNQVALGLRCDSERVVEFEDDTAEDVLRDLEESPLDNIDMAGAQRGLSEHGSVENAKKYYTKMIDGATPYMQRVYRRYLKVLDEYDFKSMASCPKEGISVDAPENNHCYPIQNDFSGASSRDYSAPSPAELNPVSPHKSIDDVTVGIITWAGAVVLGGVLGYILTPDVVYDYYLPGASNFTIHPGDVVGNAFLGAAIGLFGGWLPACILAGIIRDKAYKK